MGDLVIVISVDSIAVRTCALISLVRRRRRRGEKPYPIPRVITVAEEEDEFFLRINIIFMENRKSSGQPGKIAKVGPCRTGAVR
jgi:hypothetical protein